VPDEISLFDRARDEDWLEADAGWSLADPLIAHVTCLLVGSLVAARTVGMATRAIPGEIQRTYR
jgi:hypothetical protein